MGRISEVMYEKVPEELCSVKQVSEYYWYQNVLGLDPMFTDEAEAYEREQLKIRSEVCKKYKEEHGVSPRTNTAIYGNSNISNSVILVAKL